MNIDGPVIVGFAFVAIGLGLGTAARLGVWRGFEANYRNRSLPAAYRNSTFAFIPAALAFGSGLLARLVDLPPSLRGVTLLLYALFPAWLLVAFLIANRPPRVFKPKWLQEEELASPIGQDRDWFDGAVALGTVGVGLFTLVATILLIVKPG